ncbi:MAG TPA: hypothetical protein VH559_03345 [Gemmatimonadaceae bacterium]|jgi:hypothetical protein
MPTTEAVTNLADRGVRQRRTMGITWLVISLIATGSLIVFNAPRVWRLALVVPFALTAVGLIQAQERTCVALGAAHKRENPDGTLSDVPAEQCAAINRKVTSILVRVVLIAVAATAIVWSV